jgi:predicted transposase YbfD/YdcC
VILAGSNDYLIAVKDNQKGLLESIKRTIDELPPDQTHESLEKNKGRTERRQCSVWRDCSRIPQGWAGTKSIVYVRSSGEREKKTYEEDRYYFSSLETPDADKFARYIRQHWQVENNLHRVIDVIFLEDTTKLPAADVQKKFAIFRRIGINIFRMNGYSGLKYPLASFINRVKELFALTKIRT